MSGAIYKVGKKWRADWYDNDGARTRKRFKTKGEAEEYLDSIKAKVRNNTYIAPQKVWLFGALADSWMTNRIAESRTPGAGYRPSSLAQWQSHIAHMKACLEDVKVNAIDAQAIESAIATWRAPKDQGGRGLSQRTVAKVLTTMSRIFKYGVRNRAGNEIDPTKLIERVKETSGEQSETGEALYSGLHEVSEKEVLTPQEVKEVILAALPGLYRTIITTAIYTGARISELLALRWADVNLDHAIVTIRRTV